MFEYQEKTALITGASTGIGATFARNLAARGTNLVLVARSADKLQELASELTTRNKISTYAIPMDLSEENAALRLSQEVQKRGLHIDVLLNNAGFATHGYFDRLSTSRDHVQAMLNVVAVVDLTHAFLPAMLERGEGVIINVASTAAFQPAPYMAVYGASKAFVLSFSEALWEEYRTRGIRVLALCPGSTITPFFDVVGAEEAKVGKMRTPEQVVETAFQAVEKGRSVVVDGSANRLQTMSVRFFPRQSVAHISGNLLHPQKK